MAIEQGLLQLIAQSSAVKALVPNDVAGNPQIYWVLAPKGAKLPYILLSLTDTEDSYSTQGNTGLRFGLFQVDCYTDSKAGISSGLYTCVKISKAVRSVVDGYSGNLPDADSTAVGSIFIEKDWNMPYTEGATGFEFRRLLELRVGYYENAVTISSSSSSNTVIQGGQF